MQFSQTFLSSLQAFEIIVNYFQLKQRRVKSVPIYGHSRKCVMAERNFSPEKDASEFHPKIFHCDDGACQQAPGWV